MAKPSDSSACDLTRRSFVKLGAVGVGASMSGLAGGCSPSAGQTGSILPPPPPSLGTPPAEPFAAPPIDLVRIGFVGVGGQGSSHIRSLVRIPGCEVRAICDIVPEKVAAMQDLVEAAGYARPTGYSDGERDFERLCAEEDLDLVINATPWRWHVPICVSAMENGKHTATEVPAAVTIEECWQLVETAERTQKHCVMLENVNYGRAELMVLNMVREGLLGEILHAECGYLHDLREIKFAAEGEGLWRRDHSIARNGNLYPTHGLGPVSNCMNINRGDRYDYLVSMSGPSRGLQEYARNHYPADHPKRQEQYRLGDVNVSLIMTTNGRTIYVSHDTNLPRPYSRIHLVQGTRGIFQGYPNRIYIEGRSPEHQWEAAETYSEEFEHPLWRTEGENARGAGHGGMDFLELLQLIACLREGLPTEMNVYDAASMSAVSELTERSVANRSQPMAFPDFTRGQWRNYPRLGIVGA